MNNLFHIHSKIILAHKQIAMHILAHMHIKKKPQEDLRLQ